VACGYCNLDEPFAAAASLYPGDKSVPEASGPGLAVMIEHQAGRAVLRLQGELDTSSRDFLRRAIHSALERRPQALLIDLSAVVFADCAGLAVLVWAHQHLAEHGQQLLVTGCQPMVSRLLCLTGLDTYLHLGGRLGGGGT
jgi:anti-sigma B factor antagonist